MQGNKSLIHIIRVIAYTWHMKIIHVTFHMCGKYISPYTAPQHLVCRAVQSLHINHMQTGIIEVFICRRLHMNTSTILICIWLVCRLCTTLHTKCCGAVLDTKERKRVYNNAKARTFSIVQLSVKDSRLIST